MAVWESFVAPAPDWKWNSLIVASIILVACFLRFWKLGTLFDGMTYDEAYKGLDAIAIRNFGERPIFLDWNGGREALIVYLVAMTQVFFDYTSVSVRMINAAAGCLSILLIYLFARSIFNNQIALLSAFLLAVSKWHIIHSRYGVRAGLYLVFEVATLYFLARALKSSEKKTGSFLAAGVIGGLGFYTYIAYRIFPLVVLALVGEKSFRQNVLRHWKGIAAAAIVCITIMAPLAKFYLENRASLTDRMNRTQVWNQPKRGGEGPLKLVLDSTLKTMGLFTFQGDPIARHNVNDEPMLSPFSTAFFILGAFVVLIHPGKTGARFFIVYFFATLLPGILSVGAPNVPRVFGCLPVAVLFTSFGIFTAGRILFAYSRVLTTTFLALVLGGSFLTGMIDTMVRQPAILDALPPKIAELWGMDRDPANVARLVNQMGEGCEVFLSPQFFFHSTVEYLTYEKSGHKLVTTYTALQKKASPDKVIVVLLQPDIVNPWWLRDDPGKKFYKWWKQVYGMEPRTIRAIERKAYDPPFTKVSDRRLEEMLEENYPKAKKLQFEHFSAYVFSPRR